MKLPSSFSHRACGWQIVGYSSHSSMSATRDDVTGYVRIGRDTRRCDVTNEARVTSQDVT